ncbi:bifunctional aldehyde dehydrogenase/enoyl-CoA hydratase [Escherichia coli]|uniref:Bifunctional aldehyde dehydrogenase/enoyl-CoA hydratase n=1 Tax=Escherichia coli TaxID=562 RepID=A0A376RJ39_ECOLX|nr:bifunctional aldehyde dehydrogenase/enoyl-CoA hydratase [Escherichia coli]
MYCPQPDEAPAVHATEAFGPVATLMPAQNQRHALQLACAGGGSLAGTLVTADPQIARQFIADAARTHGRIQILNEESAKESTGMAPHCHNWYMVGLVAQEAVKN